jgi:predicted ArsR family transcriptional regulator
MTLQQQARALGDPTRHAIYRHVADAGVPTGITDLVASVGVSHNAVRQHLAKLVDAGLLVERRARPTGPGRPRLVYEVDPVAAGTWGGPGPYERLSRLLVEIIRSGRTPEEVGREAADGFRVPEPTGDVLVDLHGAMARQGFEPEARPTRSGGEVVLHACPFEATARADRDVVCGLHLGIAEGLAAGSTMAVDELVANDPRRADCRIRLHARPPAGEARPPTLTLRGRIAP